MRTLRYLTLLVLLSFVAQAGAQTGPQKESILLTATVQPSPARITLNWPTQAGTSGYTIYRKLKADNSWGSSIGTTASSATSYQDNSVTTGTYYEYKVVRAYSGGTGYGYIAAGIQVPATDYRGKLVLLVDNTFIPAANTQLTDLETDLKADGWVVLRTNLDRYASVGTVRNTIMGHYNSDPTNVKAVYIVGHLAVPYAGNINPDGHGDHVGGWPCDGYYGELNGSWTDNSVNNTSSQNSRNHNTPGDGDFDQSDFPSALELQVGRVDFFEFESFQYYAGLSETQLMINYLNRAHQFKAKQFTPQYRGCVFNNFDDLSNAFAGSGYRSISACVGSANLTDLDPNGAPFSSYVDDQSWLWTYACGGGGWTLASNVGSTGEYASNVAMGGVFNMTFGSYFIDWNTYNNFLKAPLGSGKALTNVGAGIPNWWFHHMAMGDNIGYSALVSMNNTSLYTPQNPGWQGSPYGRTTMALLGDPSLRQMMVPMPNSLQVSNSGGLASFTWGGASGVDGYYVYDMGAAAGVPTRITPSVVTGTSFSSPSVPFVAGRQYMVRAVKLETAPTGSYQNLSLGVFATASGQAQADCLGVVGGTATVGSSCNDNNACTTNDVYNASCQCVGTSITPVAAITPAGSTSFCSGGSVVLNASTGSNYSYVWKKNGTNISGATASSYTATTAGSYTVAVSVGGCSTTSSATTVTVGSAPTATITAAGATTFCAGGSVSLNASTATGNSYQWKKNGSAINGATGSSYPATTAGSYTVTITNGGCAATSSGITVTVTGAAATITAAGSTSFCTGGSVVLNAATATGNTYVWKKNGTTISGATSSSYTASTSGSYTVVVTNGGCTATSSAITVAAGAAPTATVSAGGATTFCSGGSVNLSASTASGNSYAWKNNGSAISGATSSTYAANATGSYSVTITNGGCSSTSSSIGVSVNAAPSVTASANSGNGTVTASASGGAAPYTYSWNTSPVQTSATASVTVSGSYTVTVTGANGCSATASTSITLGGSGSCTGIHTESQASWGGSWALGNPAAYRDWHFASCFMPPNYLTIGCGTRTLRLTNAAAVNAFLPSTGTVAQLPSGLLQDPGAGYSNALAGELVALKLAVRFDEMNPGFSPSTVLLKDMIIASGTFAGSTVAQLITIADNKLGSCGGVYTRTTIYNALVSINTGYEGGIESNGYLQCPVSAMQLLAEDTEMGTTDRGEETIDDSEEITAPDQAEVSGVLSGELTVTAFPNPCQGSTTISIANAHAGTPIELEFWTVDGRFIKRIAAGASEAGTVRTVQWDVTGQAAGLYVCKAKSGTTTAITRIHVE